MKRNLLVGLFSLGCALLIASEAHALFGLLHPCNPYSCWNKHNRYLTHITCRPYNAFTPICWGNLVCDGCCPSPCGVASGCLPMQVGLPPWCASYGMSGMPCGGGSCGPAGCCATDMAPMMSPMPAIVAPGAGGAPPYLGPMPSPVNGPSVVNYPRRTAQVDPWTGLTQANYSPNPYPAPNAGYYPMPMGYYPAPAWGYPQAAVPYYWYGYGR